VSSGAKNNPRWRRTAIRCKSSKLQETAGGKSIASWVIVGEMAGCGRLISSIGRSVWGGGGRRSATNGATVAAGLRCHEAPADDVAGGGDHRKVSRVWFLGLVEGSVIMREGWEQRQLEFRRRRVGFRKPAKASCSIARHVRLQSEGIEVGSVAER